MPRIRPISLQFPLAGLNRRLAYRQQAPYTTPFALNVRPDSADTGRARGGSRPGLGRQFPEQLGSATDRPIRLLSQVTRTASDGYKIWSDAFGGTALKSVWTAASWRDAAPSILPEGGTIATYEDEVGCVRSAITPFDDTQTYAITLSISPYEGFHAGQYHIYARMNNTTPVATTAGIVATLDLTGDPGDYDGSLTVYVAGVATTYDFTAGALGYDSAGEFQVLIVGNNVKCYWMGNLLVNQNVSAANGKRFGFGSTCTVAGSACLVDEFKIAYYDGTTAQSQRRVLVASAGNVFYRDTGFGHMETVTSTTNVTHTFPLQASELNGKLHIADWGYIRASGTDGTIDATGLQLDAASITSWLGRGVYPGTDVVVITNAAGAVNNGTYKIAGVNANHVTLAATAGGTGTCTYRIERAPKVYDPVANTLAIWTAEDGQVPSGRRLICTYMARLVMAGGSTDPQTWEMSRQNDAYDWDYSVAATDAQRAFAAANTDAGKLPQPITAQIPHGDDYLIWSCVDQLWILRGDPGYGGRIDNISRIIGILGGTAWAFGPEGQLVFLSRDGLMMLQPGSSQIEPLSRQVIPRELLDIDTENYEVCLAYDVRERGFHVFVAQKEVSTST